MQAENTASTATSCSSHCYDAIVDWFEANEWKEWKVSRYDNHDRQWFKKFPDEPKCKTNEPKPIQVRAMLWDYRKYGETNWVGIELELHAEPFDDGGWVLFKAHAFNSVEDIPDQVERLLVAWRAVCSAA
jgi:hypothetical protein